jgi:hypothetical protein
VALHFRLSRCLPNWGKPTDAFIDRLYLWQLVGLDNRNTLLYDSGIVWSILLKHTTDQEIYAVLLSERIQQSLEQLPTSFQAEVLDFIEYLAAKAEREAFEREKREWSHLSLSFAMRGMEDEDTSAYTLADLKVVFG